MKIYATIKASKLQNGKTITVEKGQGSNEWIETIYNVGDTPTYSVTLYPNGSIVVLDIKSEDTLFRKDITGTWGDIAKGKKKTGECLNIGEKSDGYGLCGACNEFHYKKI